MNGMTPRLKVADEIYDAAGEWFVRHRDGGLSDAEKRTFNDWLRHSPQHAQAYLEISATWEEIPSLDVGWNADAGQLIAQARAEGNLVPLTARAAMSRPAQPGRLMRWRRFGMAAAACLVLAVGAVAVWRLMTPRYTTTIGEQRSLTLPDGSMLELNARSSVEVHFNREERRIDLIEGQGLFRVATDAHRPFVVYSGPTRIRALGTQFDVYRTQGRTTVTVLEGRVAVGEVPLGVGEQLTVGRAQVSKPQRADVNVATAWTQRRLVFQSSPLSEVVEEFNRYNTRQMRIEDEALSGYRVSGVFSSTDPSALILFLRLQPGMRVTETGSQIRIAEK